MTWRSQTTEFRVPTSEECESNAQVMGPNGLPLIACWTPQIEGYVAKAWVEPIPCVVGADGEDGCCFEVYFWHDGEFPTTEGPPQQFHLCMAEQFVWFGKLLMTIEERKPWK